MSAAWAPTPVDASLAYWRAPHPGWKPENAGPTGWPKDVASAVVDVDGEPLVLIDPLAPPAGPAADAWWQWVDARRAARGGLVILVSNRYHGRSAPELVARWPGTPVYGAAATVGRASVPVTHVIADGDVAPGGIVAQAIDGLDDGEVAWHVQRSHALFVADAVLVDADGKLRPAPPSWCKDPKTYEPVFRPCLDKVLGGVRVVIASHGEAVVSRI